MDCSPPGSSTHGILQARVLEWGAIAFVVLLLLSHFSRVRLCATPETRLPRPWDSPGENTGVGCHFLLQCIKVKREREVAQFCPTLATSWTTACQASLSMGFPRQEYGSGLLFPLPGGLPDPGIEPWSAVLQAVSNLQENRITDL